jgi:DNA mismatch endonuclease (patch repair protein)
MSRIRGKDTKPETLVRKYLYSQGIRYRIHANLPGKPDIVIGKKKLAVFVNGCFWHQHGCKDSVLPKTNIGFWKRKLDSNVIRDRTTEESLKQQGWKAVTIWECQLKPKRAEKTTQRLLKQLDNNNT